MPLFFGFLTIWLICGCSIISVLNNRVAEVWILIARLTFVFIVWFIMKQKELSAHTFTSICITSDSLGRPGSFWIFYTNLEWLYFWRSFWLSPLFQNHIHCASLWIYVKMDKIFNFSTKMTPFTNWCTILVWKQLDFKIIFSFPNRAIKPLK